MTKIGFLSAVRIFVPIFVGLLAVSFNNKLESFLEILQFSFEQRTYSFLGFLVLINS